MHHCYSGIKHKTSLSLFRCLASLDPHSLRRVRVNAGQVRMELFYSEGLRHNDGKENQGVCPVPLPREKRWCRRRLGLGTEEF